MKFSDLFLPKHANSNPEIRKSAVRKLSDRNLLDQISKKDKDEAVRKLAQQRLKEV
jgi:hypothetical protein